MTRRELLTVVVYVSEMRSRIAADRTVIEVLTSFHRGHDVCTSSLSLNDMSDWSVHVRCICFESPSERREHKAGISALRSLSALMHAVTCNAETN